MDPFSMSLMIYAGVVVVIVGIHFAYKMIK